MAFKLLAMAEQCWRRVNGAHLLPLVWAGVRFVDGVQVERPVEQDRMDATDHATRFTTLDNVSTAQTLPPTALQVRRSHFGNSRLATHRDRTIFERVPRSRLQESDSNKREMDQAQNHPADGRILLDQVLTCFGSDPARERFLGLCREYFGQRVQGGPRRAEYHNLIMETYVRLRIQSPDGTVPLLTRAEVGQAIMDYFRAGP